MLSAVFAEPWVRTAVGLSVLALLAWGAGLITRVFLIRAVTAVTTRSEWRWDDAMLQAGVFRRLAQMVPSLVIQGGIYLVPSVPDTLQLMVRNVALATTAFFAVLAISAALTALDQLYQATPQGRERSIKGYVQLVKLVLFAVGGIVVLATLIGRSPLLLLSGLGAVSAVLLLVFKDTIMSVVASVQLASNDMLRVGDWIEMPSAGADGDVIDIALHTVKVKNWDKTITTIPTWRLITESFRNWRGMYDTGGRRIKRALHLDMTSVRFLEPAEIDRLSRFSLLDTHFAAKRAEIDQWNHALGEQGRVPVNQRRLTNLGCYRAYAQAYLEAHPKLHHGLFTLVRQLDPRPTGIPLELYCFTAHVGWAEYENAQGDIFDHLIAILPEFGLSLYQQPTGADLRGGLSASQAAAAPPAFPAGRQPPSHEPDPGLA